MNQQDGNADLRMVDTYIHDTNELPVDIPLTVFHGKHDPYNSIKEMEPWKELTPGKFKKTMCRST